MRVLVCLPLRLVLRLGGGDVFDFESSVGRDDGLEIRKRAHDQFYIHLELEEDQLTPVVTWLGEGRLREK